MLTEHNRQPRPSPDVHIQRGCSYGQPSTVRDTSIFRLRERRSIFLSNDYYVRSTGEETVEICVLSDAGTTLSRFPYWFSFSAHPGRPRVVAIDAIDTTSCSACQANTTYLVSGLTRANSAFYAEKGPETGAIFAPRANTILAQSPGPPPLGCARQDGA